MITKSGNTLVKQFTVMILLILVVGQGILYTWLLFYQKAFLEERLVRETTTAARQLAALAARPDVDRASLERALDLVLTTGSVLSIRIVDARGQTVVERSAPAVQAGDAGTPLFDRLFTIPPKNNLRVPLAAGAGAVELDYSGRPVNDVMDRFLVIPPVMQTMTFLVVITAIVLFFRRKVSSPVEKINAALGRMTAGDLVAEIPDVDGVELGSIADGVHFLADKLSSTLSRVNNLSNDVAAALERLTRAIENVRDSTRSQTTAIDNVIAVIRRASAQQSSTTAGTDQLSHASDGNVSSLFEMRTAATEIATSTQRLFRSAADAHEMITAMSATTTNIANSSGEAYRAMESTSASVEEIDASLASVRENARQSSAQSRRVRQLLTDRGTLAVSDAVEAMERITEEVDRFDKIVTRLDTQSKEIVNVLAVIEEVADRTRLLSLNASIIAAQAGEQGRGFAVVAGEIRALSDGTVASAKDIASIVTTIRSQIREAVDAIRGGIKKVEEGKDLILKSGEAMGETLEAAQKSAQMTALVEKAADEQATGLHQIRLATEDVRHMLEQVAKSTAEERLSAERMLRSVAEVKEVAELVRKGSNEHAAGTDIISRNLEDSRDMVTRINEAAQDQLRANEEIVKAVEQIKHAGLSALHDLEDMTLSFDALRNEVEDLKHEMAAFRMKRETA